MIKVNTMMILNTSNYIVIEVINYSITIYYDNYYYYILLILLHYNIKTLIMIII